MNPRLIASVLLAAGWLFLAIARGMSDSEAGEEN